MSLTVFIFIACFDTPVEAVEIPIVSNREAFHIEYPSNAEYIPIARCWRRDSPTSRCDEYVVDRYCGEYAEKYLLALGQLGRIEDIYGIASIGGKDPFEVDIDYFDHPYEGGEPVTWVLGDEEVCKSGTKCLPFARVTCRARW